MAIYTPFMADAFVDSVGINVHSTYGTLGDGNAYGQNWVPLVSQLGVRHVRDNGNPGSAGAAGAAAMAAAQSLDGAGIGVLRIAAGTSSLANLIGSGAPAPEAVEPYNEYDSSVSHGSDPAWWTTIQTFQPTLYSQVKAQWPNAVVLSASMANNVHHTTVGSLVPNVDVGNVHIYQWPAGEPEYGTITLQSQLPNLTTQAPGLPLWLTETGLAAGDVTDPDILTTELAQARLLLRYALYGWAPTPLDSISSQVFPTGSGGMGFARTYFYELLNEHGSPTVLVPGREDRLGLYRSDLTPKLAATALGNLLHLLADPGPPFTTSDIEVVHNAKNTDALSYMVFQKRNGDYWIAYWASSNVVERAGGGPGGITPPTGVDQSGGDLSDTLKAITFQFNKMFQRTAIYRPLYGATPIIQTGATHSVTIQRRSEVQLIRLSGRTRRGWRGRGLRSYYDTRSGSAG